MKNLKLIVLFSTSLFITFLFFLACSNQDSIEKPLSKNMANAKKWYEQVVKQKTIFLYNNNTYELQPEWELAEIYKNDTIEVVEIPFLSNSELEVDYKLDGIPYYCKLSKESSEENYFKLIIITDKTGNTFGYNMVTYSDIEKNVSIKSNTYLKQTDHLNAFVALYDFNSNFIKGYEYVHGELINKYSPNLTKSSLGYREIGGRCYQVVKKEKENNIEFYFLGSLVPMSYCTNESKPLPINPDQGGNPSTPALSYTITYEMDKIACECYKIIKGKSLSGNEFQYILPEPDMTKCTNKENNNNGSNSNGSNNNDNGDNNGDNDYGRPPLLGFEDGTSDDPLPINR